MEKLDEKRTRITLEEEALKLGVDTSEIETSINPDPPFIPWGNSGRNRDSEGKRYKLELGLPCNKDVIRHELYHIYRGDCDKMHELGKQYGRCRFIFLLQLKELYIRMFCELRAQVYASWGLKL